MNDDCIIKAYVYKKAGFNKLSYLSSTYKCNFLGADNKQ